MTNLQPIVAFWFYHLDKSNFTTSKRQTLSPDVSYPVIIWFITDVTNDRLIAADKNKPFTHKINALPFVKGL